MDISYDYYKTFYYVARYHSFSAAAAALLCGQPNVTKAIGNLEAQLGCPLFYRTSRGASLTPEGEQLYAHISAACAHIAQGEAELLSHRALETGIVSIGATETALNGLLIPAIEKFHRDHPQVKLRIFSYTTAQASLALKNGEVDFCLMTTPLEEHAYFRSTPVREYREVLCAGGQYRFLSEKTQDLSILEAYPVVAMGRNTKTYAFHSQFLLSRVGRWQPDIEVSSADQLLPMVRRGLGIGFIPEFFLTEALASGDIQKIPLKEEMPPRQICLVEEKSRRLSFAAGGLAAAIAEFHPL